MPELGKNQSNIKAKKLLELIKKRFSFKKDRKALAIDQIKKAKNVGAFPTLAQAKKFPELLSTKERQIFSVLFITFIISAIGLVYGLYNSQRVTIPVAGGEYTEGLIGTPQLINPLYSSASDVDSDLTALIYSGLMRYDSQEGLVKDLAEDYSVSEDGLVYTFTLRDDALWQDGTKVDIRDVIFTYSSIKNPEYRSPLEVVFQNVDIAQVDDRVISFTLAEPYAPFLSLMTTGILPSHVWQQIIPANAASASFNRQPIGSGPYQLDKIARDSRGNIRSYTLKINNRYYGHKPYISTLIFKFYPELTSALEALRNKNIEGLAYIPRERSDEFSKIPGTTIVYPSLQQYTALFINEDNDGILSDTDLRKAIDLAIDKQKIADEINVKPLSSFILPNMSGYDKSLDSAKSYNTEEASRLLEEAGWTYKDGATFRTNDNDEVLRMTLTYLESDEYTIVTSLIKEELSNIGFEVTLKPVDSVTFQSSTLTQKDYQVLLAGELYGTDPDPYAFWHSSQTGNEGLNLSLYKNSDADKAIVKIREAQDNETKAQGFTELRTAMSENMPAIFLYQPSYAYATSSRLKGQAFGSIVEPFHRFSNINDWYIKTRRVLK